MNKNLFMAMGLSMMVYGFWLMYMAKYQTPPVAAPTATTATLTPGAATTPGAAPIAANAPPAAQPAGAESKSARLFTWSVGGDNLMFASKGGALAGYVFQDVSGPTELLPLEDSRFFATWPEVDFEPPTKAEPGSGFVLQAVHPSGARLRKEYLWAQGGGMHSVRITASNPGKTPLRLEGWNLSLGPGLGTVASEESENQSNLRVVASWLEPKRKIATVEALDDGTFNHKWNWVAIDNRYFLTAAFVTNEDFPSVTVSHPKLGENEPPLALLAAAAVELPPGGTRTWEVPFYLGPKDYVGLIAMGKGLEEAVDFGYFGFLGKLTFKLLRGLNAVVGNYGIAIILLTLVLQALMLPMTLKSLKTSMAMQKLQPKIQELQKKFADDPRRMNVEMMELYKSSGTNPLGGCLPLLAQLPIFYALFTMLRNCWELHGAPFALWIKDLSAADPYHVLPLVMGALMFFQQRLSPAAPDPAQQKIFMFMPVLFIFMFWSFPSGLVLYWMVSSLWGLGQQMVYKRYAKI